MAFDAFEQTSVECRRGEVEQLGDLREDQAGPLGSAAGPGTNGWRAVTRSETASVRPRKAA